jgi:hypothetical protein
VVAALLTTAAVFVFWVLVIFVMPVLVALTIASWIPQAGQWRTRAGRRRTRKKKVGDSALRLTSVLWFLAAGLFALAGVRQPHVGSFALATVFLIIGVAAARRNR